MRALSAGEATARGTRRLPDQPRTRAAGLAGSVPAVDFARKVVGVGSVGTRSWMALLLGDHERDPLFLQAKEAGPSALEQFVGPSEYDNAGQRVVVGQRLMQAVTDSLRLQLRHADWRSGGAIVSLSGCRGGCRHC